VLFAFESPEKSRFGVFDGPSGDGCLRGRKQIVSQSRNGSLDRRLELAFCPAAGCALSKVLFELPFFFGAQLTCGRSRTQL
jgi:hypothetical protein